MRSSTSSRTSNRRSSPVGVAEVVHSVGIMEGEGIEEEEGLEVDVVEVEVEAVVEHDVRHFCSSNAVTSSLRQTWSK